jgi:hypothetical protein
MTRHGTVPSQQASLKIVASNPRADRKPSQVKTETTQLKIEWWYEERTPRP